MQADFKVKRVTKTKDKDLTEALDIYLHSVDEDAVTSTTQIRDYIQSQYDDKRKLYFYILYSNGDVVGFAEYAYLQDTETLFIDYLCTRPRMNLSNYLMEENRKEEALYYIETAEDISINESEMSLLPEIEFIKAKTLFELGRKKACKEIITSIYPYMRLIKKDRFADLTKEFANEKLKIKL